MTTINFVEILVYLGIIVAITPLMGGYMKRVFSGERTFLDPVLRPIERGIYRVCGVDASEDQSWVDWTVTMLIVKHPVATNCTPRFHIDASSARPGLSINVTELKSTT